MELKMFAEPDVEFNCIERDKYQHEYYLEVGDDFIYDSEIMDDNDIEEWARDNEYLDNESDYIDENGTIDIKGLRVRKRETEDEYLPSWATPQGRAFLFFSENVFDFPGDIDIDVVDGIMPGNDWQFVTIKGIDSIIKLQEFLEEENVKCNFEFK